MQHFQRAWFLYISEFRLEALLSWFCLNSFLSYKSRSHAVNRNRLHYHSSRKGRFFCFALRFGNWSFIYFISISQYLSLSVLNHNEVYHTPNTQSGRSHMLTTTPIRSQTPMTMITLKLENLEGPVDSCWKSLLFFVSIFLTLNMPDNILWIIFEVSRRGQIWHKKVKETSHDV